jgi:hypothetical protein
VPGPARGRNGCAGAGAPARPFAAYRVRSITGTAPAVGSAAFRKCLENLDVDLRRQLNQGSKEVDKESFLSTTLRKCGAPALSGPSR